MKKSFSLLMLILSSILISSATTYAVVTKDDSASVFASEKQDLTNSGFDPFLWDPFRQMDFYREHMRKMMNELDASFVSGYNPELSLEQTENAYLVRVDLPGLDKDSINVEIENNLLTISGERKEAKSTETSDGYYHSEQSYGSFQRNITLPDDVVSDKTQADYVNGVLEISIPRRPVQKPKSNKLKVPIN